LAIPARNLDSRGFSESYAAWRSDFCDGDSELVEMSREDGVSITQAIATMAKGVYQEPLNSSTLTHAISKGTYRPERYNHIIRLKPAPSLALHRSWERWQRRSPERC
jgi:hypothetical protein